MMSLIAGILLCVGQTENYDISVSVDSQKKVFSGTFTRKDNLHHWDVNLSEPALLKENGCLKAGETSVVLCLNEPQTDGSIEFVHWIKYAPLHEKGTLNCKAN